MEPGKLALASFVALTVLVLPAALPAQDDLQAFLARVRSPDDEVRLAARKEAAKLGAKAVLPLAMVIQEGEREPSTTARHALEAIVHHAGRPAAENERAPVLRELEKVVLMTKHPYLRRECLWLIGFIGGDQPSVDAAERCLWDEDLHVAEVARLVLERMPGKAAVEALAVAVRRADDDQRPDLIYSLAKKGDRSAAELFLQLTRARSRKVRLAAFEGLARLGAPEAIEPLTAALRETEDPDRQKLFNEYLRLADLLAEGGGADGGKGAADARSMFAFALANSPADFQRERALHRLAPQGDESAVDTLLAALGDSSERVRRLAIGRFAALEGPRVTEALARGFESAKPPQRALILRALAERDSQGAKPLVERASKSDNAELKVVALDILGELAKPEMEATYFEVAQGGSDPVRPAALKGYLAVAEARLQAGEAAQASAMFARALDLAAAGEFQLRSQALNGLIAVGDPAAIDKLGGYLSDSVLAVEAANGIIGLAARIAEAGDKDAAERHLLRVVAGELPPDVIARAAQKLRDIGRDPLRQARAAGFVVDWWLTGPIQDADGEGLARKFEPEEKIDLGQMWNIGPRRFRWRRAPGLARDGRIDLLPVFRRSARAIAFGYAELESDSDREVILKMGSDDGIACWLNGERIHFQPASRRLTVDEDSVKARLKAGKNRLLVKVSQTDGEWGFVLRVTDAQGAPIDLTTSAAK